MATLAAATEVIPVAAAAVASEEAQVAVEATVEAPRAAALAVAQEEEAMEVAPAAQVRWVDLWAVAMEAEAPWAVARWEGALAAATEVAAEEAQWAVAAAEVEAATEVAVPAHRWAVDLEAEAMAAVAEAVDLARTRAVPRAAVVAADTVAHHQ